MLHKPTHNSCLFLKQTIVCLSYLQVSCRAVPLSLCLMINYSCYEGSTVSLSCLTRALSLKKHLQEAINEETRLIEMESSVGFTLARYTERRNSN